MIDRISCCVPFCRRTYRNDEGYAEHMCGKHWRLSDKRLRMRRSKLERRYRKRFGNNGFWEYPAGSPERLEAVRLWRLLDKLWERCKTQAIERAAGI